MGLGPPVCLRHMRFMRGRTPADPAGAYWLCDVDGCDVTQWSSHRGNYFSLTDSQRAEVDRHAGLDEPPTEDK